MLAYYAFQKNIYPQPESAENLESPPSRKEYTIGVIYLHTYICTDIIKLGIIKALHAIHILFTNWLKIFYRFKSRPKTETNPTPNGVKILGSTLTDSHLALLEIKSNFLSPSNFEIFKKQK